MTPGHYGLVWELPAGWIELPEPRPDLPAWAQAEASRVWAHASEDPDQNGLAATAHHLLAVALDSISRRPALAAVLLPDPAGPMAVLVEIVPLDPDPGLPFTVEAFAASLSRPHKDLARSAEIGVITDLPLGPAVRVRRLWRGPRGRSLRRELQEELTYMILPSALSEEGLVVTASWSDLSLAEAFAAEVDVLMRALHVIDPL